MMVLPLFCGGADGSSSSAALKLSPKHVPPAHTPLLDEPRITSSQPAVRRAGTGSERFVPGAAVPRAQTSGRVFIIHRLMVTSPRVTSCLLESIASLKHIFDVTKSRLKLVQHSNSRCWELKSLRINAGTNARSISKSESTGSAAPG